MFGVSRNLCLIISLCLNHFLLFAVPPSGHSEQPVPVADAARLKELVAELKNPDRFARKRAVCGIGELGPIAQSAIPILRDRVREKDEDEDVRMAAARVLARLAHTLPEAKRSLVELLQDCADRTCLFAVEAWRLGKPPLDADSITALKPLLGHEDPLLRQSAAGVFMDAGTAAKPVVPALIEALDGGGGGYLAGITLLKLAQQDADTVDQLIKGLGNRSKFVRKSCAEILSVLGLRAPQAATPLLHALSDPDEEVRKAAAKALGGPWSSRGVPVSEADAPALLDLLQGKDEWRRRVAARFFWQPPETERDWLTDVVANAMQHADSKVRANAASLLYQVDISGLRVSDLLLDAANDPALEVRKAAIRAAIQFSRPPAGALVAIVAATKDQDRSIREGAQTGLFKLWKTGDHAENAIPEIVAYLSDENMKTRLAAAKILGCIGPDATVAVSQLVGALRDEDQRVRDTAGHSLSLIGRGVPMVIEDLGMALRHQDARIRNGVATTLGRFTFQQEPASRLLVNVIMNDPDAAVRAVAARSLCKLAESAPEYIPLLIDELGKNNVAAAKVLGGLESGATETVPALVAAIRRTNDDEFRVAAMLALGKLGSDARVATAALLDLLVSPEYSVQWAAIAVLGDIGADADSTLPYLIPIVVKSDSPYLRLSAIHTIGKIGSNSPKAVAVLVGALSDERKGIRRAAICALQDIGPNAGNAIGHLVAALSDSDADVREAAAQAIPDMGMAARDALPALVAALNDPARKVPRSALRSLGEMGPAAESALPELEKLLAKKDCDFSSYSLKRAIEQIRPPKTDDAPP